MAGYLHSKEHAKRQQGRILAILAESPMPARELGVAMGLGKEMIRHHLGMLQLHPRQIYIADFTPRPGGGRRREIYAVGDLPNAILPRNREPQRARINAANDAVALGLLKTKPMTVKELAKRSGQTIQHARRCIERLRDDQQIYIIDWAVRPANTAPVYAPGTLPDAPRKEVLEIKRVKRQTALHFTQKCGWAAALGL